MLATLVIGLREGLEAALIVGIIAAFLRRNGHSLKAMWVGVIAAVALSIGIGVALEIVSASLPQAQQEGMESVIGAVAIVFVTGMIVWMHRHATHMRGELETSATAALRGGTAWALAGMAFLAVLKEGFETSVFLLATFQSSTSTVAAVAGAVIGILAAVAIGIGIYHGGVRVNLGRFFRGTGVFLIFVAAGLVVSALRTAHEAGWVDIGQQRTVDLSWLAPNGSIQAALVTGVLGIPADPRVLEVLGWFLYLVPVLGFTLWPRRLRPAAHRVPAVQFSIAGALAVAALLLVVFVPAAAAFTAPASAALVPSGTARLTVTDGGSARLAVTGVEQGTILLDAGQHTTDPHAGIAAQRWTDTTTSSPTDRPSSLTLDDLVALTGGRLPVGVNASQNPGPFAAAWTQTSTRSVWATGARPSGAHVLGAQLLDAQLLDAQSQSVTTLTITGGGLPGSRTFSLTPTARDTWGVAPGYVQTLAARYASASSAASELLLWRLALPLALAVAAAVLAACALRNRRRLDGAAGRTRLVEAGPSETEEGPSTAPSLSSRSTSHASK